VTKGFLSKTLNYELPQALQRLQQSNSQHTQFQVFSHLWAHHLTKSKLAINHQKPLRVAWPTAFNYEDIHDIQDSVHHVDQLFLKYWCPNAMKTQMKMLVAKDQHQLDQLEKLHLKIASILDSGSLGNQPADVGLGIESVQSLGLLDLFERKNDSTCLLNPAELQTCLIVVCRFLEEIAA